MQRISKIIKTQNNGKQKKSIPWLTDSITIMRKKAKALRPLSQRRRNNDKLRENRKHKYLEDNKNNNTKIEERISTRGKSTVKWQQL